MCECLKCMKYEREHMEVQGSIAFNHNRLKEDNPYKGTDEEALEEFWNKGWQDAKEKKKADRNREILVIGMVNKLESLIEEVKKLYET